MNKPAYRIYQKTAKFLVRFMKWRKPELFNGAGSLSELPKLIQSKEIKSLLIVTDKGITSLGLMAPMLQAFDTEGIKYVIYDDTVPNPTIDNIEAALKIYLSNNCKGLIAFGGGSSMDCAKGVGCRIARPELKIPQLRGNMKVRKELPMLIAIPTTAGTGSETTLAAVITNSETHEKYSINDISLIPKYAVLDPMVTIGLPPHITSTTGMDALTHAIEAYIGHSNTRETEDMAKMATKLIFENIYKAYTDGKNVEARENMQKAAYFAGIAFTRASVGNVHAIAHTLGGYYGVAHGLANAVILPYVLEFYGKSAHRRLAELADVAGVAQRSVTLEQKAIKFITAIKDLNRSMNIPDKIVGKIKEEDIQAMIKNAFREANPQYPVPKIMSKRDFREIYYLIKG